MGFIAQDVKDVLPQAVLYDDLAVRYTLSYTEIFVLAVSVVHELSEQVEQLAASNEALWKENQILKDRLKRLEEDIEL